MLPYTTYKIPEDNADVTVVKDKWLWYFLPAEATPAQMELLEKISSALQRDFANDVACIVIYNPQRISFRHPQDHPPALVVSFGVPPQNFGLWIEVSKPGIRWMENFTFIMAPTPAVLEQDLNAKKALWKHIQLYLGG